MTLGCSNSKARYGISACDIVNDLGCVHRTTLELADLETPIEKAMQLVQAKGGD